MQEARGDRLPLAALPRRARRQDARGGPLPRLERHDEARAGARGQGAAHARRQPGRLGGACERSARRHAVACERVAQDRRGMQPHVRLLRHPADTRQAAIARRRRRGRRGAAPGGRRRDRAEPDLARHRRLRARPAEGGAHGAGRPRASRRRREGGALGAPLLPLPGDDRRGAHRLAREPPARRALRGHAAAACGRRDAQEDAARARQGPAEARRRAPSHRDPRPHLPHRVHRGPPGRDGRRVRRARGLREVGALRARRRLPVLGRGDVRRPRASGQGARARRGQPRAKAHGPAAQDRPREEQGAHRARARRARRGTERGARPRDEGPPRGPGPGDRRLRLPLRRRVPRRRATSTSSGSCSTNRRRAPRAR